MKKTLLLFFLLLLGVMPVLAKKSPAEKAAGTYNGLLFIGMNDPVNEGAESSEASIKLEAETDNTVKFILPNFKYGMMNLGDIVLTGIPVSEDESGRIVFGKNKPQSLSISIFTANVNIDETTSYIDADYANIDVFVSTSFIGNLNIYVRFQGNNGEYHPEGIAQKMEGTRNGKIYTDISPMPTSESSNSPAEIEIVAQGADSVRLFIKNLEIEGLSFDSDVMFNTRVTDNGDGTVAFSDATTTGSILGTIEYKLKLVGSNSLWSADSVGIAMEADINGLDLFLVFTTGNLPAPIGEDPIVTTGPAAEIAGSYNAGIYVSLGTPVTSDTEKFTEAEILLTAQDENTVTFTLKDFSLDGVNSLGDIVLKDIPVIDNEDGTYKFGANNPQGVVLASGFINADVKIDEATSYVAGDDLYIDVPVQAVGEYIYVHVGLPVTTGITTIITRHLSDGNIYDLSGRRLTQRPTHPGVYILGGRKVYIR